MCLSSKRPLVQIDVLKLYLLISSEISGNLGLASGSPKV